MIALENSKGFGVFLDKLDKNYLIPYRLQFFAEGAEKTEEPTAKKLSDARKEGQVARSKELTTSIELIALFLALKVFLGYIRDRLAENFYSTYQNMDRMLVGEFTTSMASTIINNSIVRIIIICLPTFAVAVGVTFVINLYQVKWKVSGKPLSPKLSKMNPVSGFKKIFSIDKLVTLVVEVLKIFVIVYIAYNTLKDEWDTLLILYDIDLFQAIALLGDLVINLGIRIGMFFLIIGVADYLYQKFKFKKDMRMTKQEVKDEFKHSEGDPKIKQKIRARMMQASQRRMMQNLPEADVVITNPTHLAAAIKYDRDTSEAPILIAKGADYLANKIKEVAKENKIEVVENKPLARMLYYNVEVGAEIPPELYQMTAEVLAYVYNLKGKL
ncbi:MAG: flagellar biosynthesis protein FlhB [Clostridiales bacterium]|nr:flagellar biosynthesis protein FlhB [Clostridiales bacterium]